MGTGPPSTDPIIGLRWVFRRRSATTVKLKREQLTELLGDVVHTYGVEDARRDGIIPEFDWTVHPTPLDPYEREEWDEATESISDQFKHIRRSAATKRILRQVPVPFTELSKTSGTSFAHTRGGGDGGFFDDEEIPDEWSNLQATIHSRTWIRHRSQPKIEEAIELAKDYLGIRTSLSSSSSSRWTSTRLTKSQTNSGRCPIMSIGHTASLRPPPRRTTRQSSETSTSSGNARMAYLSLLRC